MADTPLHRETYPELANRKTWLEALRERRTALVERTRKVRQQVDEIKLATVTRQKVEKRLARIDKSLQEMEDKLNKLDLAITGVFD